MKPILLTIFILYMISFVLTIIGCIKKKDTLITAGQTGVGFFGLVYGICYIPIVTTVLGGVFAGIIIALGVTNLTLVIYDYLRG